jgi:hypothetical protein
MNTTSIASDAPGSVNPKALFGGLDKSTLKIHAIIAAVQIVALAAVVMYVRWYG